jgi:hypothetical protein
MVRTSALVGMAVLGLAILVGTGTSQDAKKDPVKTKAYLPPGWKALGLTKEQSLEVSKIHGNYKTKIKALEDQIMEAKSQERQEMVKLLTVDQKDKLQKLVIGEDVAKDAPKKDAEPKKDK